MSSPVRGGREVRRFEWTAAGSTSTVEGRTHVDVHRIHAIHSAGLLAGHNIDLEIVRDYSVFRAPQKEFVGTVAGV